MGVHGQIAAAKDLLLQALHELKDSNEGVMLEAWISCTYSETLLQESPPALDEALL